MQTVLLMRIILHDIIYTMLPSFLETWEFWYIKYCRFSIIKLMGSKGPGNGSGSGLRFEM